jgi:hypothetical protein
MDGTGSEEGFIDVNFVKILSFFGNECPKMAPRTTQPTPRIPPRRPSRGQITSSRVDRSVDFWRFFPSSPAR